MNFNFLYVLTLFTIYPITVSCLQDIYEPKDINNELKTVQGRPDTPELKDAKDELNTINEVALERHQIYHEDLQLLLRSLYNWTETLLKVHDPFRVESISLDVENKIVKSNGFLKKLLFSDISKIKFESQITNHTTSENEEMYFDLSVNSEELQVSGSYELDFSFLAQFFVNGAGEFSISLHGINISSELHVIMYPDKSLFIPWTRVNYDVRKIQVKFDGLYGGGLISRLVNIIFNDVLTKIVIQYKSLITGILSIYLHIAINRNIDNITIESISDSIHRIIGE